MFIPDPKIKMLPRAKARYTSFQHAEEAIQEAVAAAKAQHESQIRGRTCHIKQRVR